MIRKLLERLARNRRFWRRFPARFGGRRILVSPDAALRWLKPGERAFDPVLLQLVEQLAPGEVAWDVGANVGVFTIAAAHRTGAKVLAVEPDPFLVELLERSREANPDLDLTLIRAAVSDSPGKADLAVAGRGRACNALSAGHLPQDHGSSRAHIIVRTTTLDALLDEFPAPAFLKIDIEGAEEMALAGARRMLNLIRPRICIEVRPETEVAVRALLDASGYEVSGSDNLLAVPRADFDTGCADKAN